MCKCSSLVLLVLSAMLLLSFDASAQQAAGSIRGLVLDADFQAPLPEVVVTIVETGRTTQSTESGNYVLSDVAPGAYTLVFAKAGYVRQVKGGVVVVAGRLTDVDVRLSGEFTDMEEFVVQDVLALGAASEAALLQLRLDSPALMDSISSDLMSRAGASDAASALRLVTGATVQDGKFAVIRGLPDRYVSSQMNGVRLPSADEDTRAVELDQFPAAVIESVQVSKTFTPDQQGDASGGAVDVRLKGIPDGTLLQFGAQTSYNDQVTGRDDFLTSRGGGVNTWGKDDRDPQTGSLGTSWDGAVGVIRDDAPYDYKLSAAFGGRQEVASDWTFGGFASLFYERDSAFFDDGVDDSLWLETASGNKKLTPQTSQGGAGGGDFKTALFDVTQGSESVQWGGLGSLGLRGADHAFGLTFLHTHSAEDVATLAEDTRGKKHFFPGYDPNDPEGPGNSPDELLAAPYLRTETLEYTERTTQTVQLDGWHRLHLFGNHAILREPELTWRLSTSRASLDQPDKRQFGTAWQAASFNPVTGFTTPPLHVPFKPAANILFGNLQRIWKEIEEDSDQYTLDLRLPFEQWSGREGALSVGVFRDEVERDFDQDTFSNFNETGLGSFQGGFDQFWSAFFPFEQHPITAAETDVDYHGEHTLSAWYSMLELPLSERWTLVGGARVERTAFSVVNDPEEFALWFPPDGFGQKTLLPGEADVDFEQRDVLPSVGLEFRPTEGLTLRGAYSETVARQTFKELTPILQQEYLGGPIFVGNPDLQMSSLQNYDLRVDYSPYAGGLYSISWFEKDIEDPIEYVQRIFPQVSFTTAENYPKGELNGWEVEVRHDLGHFWEELGGLGVGANATFIHSRVRLPEDEAATFAALGQPMRSRDMTNAPEHLYNLYVTYDIEETGTRFAVFYTVTGDRLVAGAGEEDGNFVPNVYAKEYGTLNASVSQEIGKRTRVTFQAKNLTNPEIEEVYRLDGLKGGDATRTSSTRGREFSLAVSVRF